MKLPSHWNPEVRVGYIDGDLLVYPICVKGNEEESFAAVRRSIDSFLDTLQDRIHLDDYTIFLGGSSNFRKEVYPAYKANRKDVQRPKWLLEAKRYLFEQRGAIAKLGYEADDLLGIALTEDTEGLLMSYDKDLDQIPGWHYDWYHNRMYHIDQAQAERFLAVQCLAGDMTDNVPGIKGIGPKKAEAILGEHKDFDVYLEDVVMAYVDKGIPVSTFKQYYKCLKILRSPEQQWPELERYTNE